jgi:hypothetical protein
LAAKVIPLRNKESTTFFSFHSILFKVFRLLKMGSNLFHCELKNQNNHQINPMKKLLLLFTIMGFTLSMFAQVTKTVDLSTAGTLSSTLTVDELNTVTNLTLTGSIDARDFRTMRDLMPVLAEIDMSGANIVAYNGTEGTSHWSNTNYEVNVIPETAFMYSNWQGKTSLTTIRLPNTAIGLNSVSFYNCSGLKIVNLPTSLITIGSSVFAYCNQLSSIAIPSSVLQIFNGAFNGSGLTSVTIPASVLTIESGSFMHCYSLPSIDVDPLNPNFKSVDGVLFDKTTTKLFAYPAGKTNTNYTIPSTVSTINESAFLDCSSITSVTIPTSVKTIGWSAFNGCNGLTELEIPSSVTSIGDGAFQGCGNLSSITLTWPVPLGLSSSYDVFWNVNKTTCVLQVPYGTASLYAAANQWKDFTNIVEAANGFSLGAANASIGAAANSTASVDLNANVSWTASSDQTWLIVAPASGINSGTLTFTAAANTSIATRPATITVSATGYGSQTLLVTQEGNDGPINITAGTLSTTFSASELASITKLTLTGTIDARDFKTMRDLMPMLAEIDLSGATIVAYNGTEGTSIWSNNTYAANAIPEFAFFNSNWQGKSSLTSFLFPTTTTVISQYAFNHCDGLEALLIPQSVVLIGQRVFGYFEGLITVDSNNPNYSSLDDVLFNKDQTTLIVSTRSKLGTYIIPSTVKNINEVAFEGCYKLTDLRISSSVQTIGYGAFWGCSGLNSIIVESPLPLSLTNSDVFNYVNKSSCILNVPYGAKSLYAAANQWKDFANIVEAANGFSIGVATSSIGAAANSTANIDLNANVSWSASSDQPWLTVSPVSGTSSVTLTLTAAANSSVTYRKAIVTVSATGYDSQTVLVTQDGNNGPIAVTAGTLSTTFSANELALIAKLTLTGTIDARDFKTMRDLMPNLAEIDISGASIVGYTGSEGTAGTGSISYTENEIPTYSFYNPNNGQGKISLTSIAFPLSITSIGNYAILNCGGLTAVSIPASVTSIGRSAFSNCTALTSLTFEPSSQLATIGNYAFRNCNKLTQITLPSSVTVIDYGAFMYCSEIVSISIPTNLTTLGTYAFGFCSKLTAFSIPSSVTTIGNVVFLGSKATITVDSNNPNYSSVDGVLFNKDQTRLMYYPGPKTGSYLIPSTVTNVAVDAFYNCSLLTSVNLPVGLTTLEDWAFENCTGLTTISLPAAVSSIGSNALYNCSGLTSIFVNNPVPIDLSSKTNVFFGINKTSCILNVPFGTASLYASANQWKDFANIVESANGFSLAAASTRIGSAAGSTATVALNANVAWTASSDQTWLTVAPASGTQSSTLTFTAEANTFVVTRSATITVSATGYNSQTVLVTQDNGPLNLTAGTLSTTLTESELASLTKLTLTGTIDARDFKTMRDLMPLLAEVDLSGAIIATYTGTEGTAGTYNTFYPVNEIPQRAFLNSNWQGKTSLTSVVLPSSATSIGYSAFENCYNIVSLNIPPSIITIRSSAFANCSGLTTIVIPSSVTTIGSDAFNSCNGLTTISIPSSVISLGSSVFMFCNQLASITVDANNPNYSSLDGVLLNKAQTVLIQCPARKSGGYVIPSTVVTIEAQSFWDCGSLTSLTIPTSVKSIRDGAFTGCYGLTSLTLPASISSIGAYAFQNCQNLASITAKWPVPLNLASSSNVFNYVNKTTCTLNVPYGASPLYAVANQWKDFTHIVEAISGFSVNAATASVGASSGSTASVELKANVAWTATSDQTWLTVAPNAGNANNTLTFTSTSANPSIGVRMANITVSASGFDSQTVVVTQEGTFSPINITAGTLSTTLTAVELATVAKLTLTGTIDARDFRTMRDLMPMLAEVDLSGVTIVAYSGAEGPWYGSNRIYSANGIPDFAFRNPSSWPGGKISLISFTMPLSATSIGNEAFENCSGLRTFTFGDTAELLSIGSDAFYNCTGLTTLVLPQKLTTLSSWAFESCTGLTSVYLPASINNIGSYALYNCSGLTSIIIDKTTPVDLSAMYEVFYNVNKNTCTLIVPPGSESLYAAAVQWKDFINIKPNNLAPVTNAGEDQSVNEGILVTLDGSASSDPDGDLITLSWVAPEGITLSSTTSATITFTAPEIWTDTAYTFTLTVTDGTATTTDTVIVTVKQVNKAPVANAGTDQTVNENTLVTLDGSASSDFDRDVVSYIWTAPAGITLSATTSANPTFMAPEIMQDTQYKFSLVVSDGTLTSTIDEVIITVKQVNKAPIASAGLIQTVNEGALVTLDGTGSYDFDGNVLTYYWTAPTGIMLSSANTVTPTFTAPEVTKDTNFAFLLYVNDGFTNSNYNQTVIIVKHISQLPVANAGLAQVVNEGSAVTLDGSGSTDADALTYLWTSPEGITLSSTTSVNPSFVAPLVSQNTTYTFSLVVNDGNANSSTAQVTVTVTDVNNAPVANAGIAQTLDEGTSVTLDGSGSADADGDALIYQWTAPEGITLSSTTSETITFTAPAVNENTAYTFTLTVTDGKGGTATSSVVITIKDVITAIHTLKMQEMKIYPNPVTGQVTIDLGESIDEPVHVIIYSIQGKMLMQQQLNESKTVINLSSLTSGSYLVKVDLAKGTQTKVLIKK